MTGEHRERAWLDANYDLRAAVPEHPTYFACFATESDGFRAAWAGQRLDLAYGDTARQAIDLFQPVGPAPAPVLVFIHGGYWQRFDRRAFAFAAAPLVARGAAVAMLGYDLAPAVGMDEIVHQTRAGLAWLYRNAADLGIDRTRIHVAGHSAGGHLTAMALATDWAGDWGLPADLIGGACAISGIFDLDPIRRCFLNEVVGLDEAEVRRNSPLHLPLHGRCPVIVAVGGGETQAFLEQSEAYATRLAGAGRAHEHMVVPGLDHFAIVMAMADGASPLVEAITRLMDP